MSASTKRFFMAAAAAACILAACAPSNAPETVAARSGGVTVTIPAVSPLLPAGRDASSRVAKPSDGSAGSRAFLGRDRVEILLFDSDSEIVDSHTIFSDDVISAETNVRLYAPEGEGYTVRADIYNTRSSETAPMCSGTSAPFAIVIGTIGTVEVTCLPVSATAITLGQTVGPVELIPGNFNLKDHEDPEVIFGQEAWFSFVAGPGSSLITSIPNAVSQPGYLMVVLDSDGNELGSLFPALDVLDGIPVEEYYDRLFMTEEGRTYYICLVTFDMSWNSEVVMMGNGCSLTVVNEL